jgi:hypothetical protein
MLIRLWIAHENATNDRGQRRTGTQGMIVDHANHEQSPQWVPISAAASLVVDDRSLSRVEVNSPLSPAIGHPM